MKRFLFVLSPSLALYNQWRNLLIEIISYGYSVDIFLLKPNTYKNLLSSLYIFDKDLGINKFFVITNPLIPFLIKKLTLEEVKMLLENKSFRFQLKIRILISRIVNKINFNLLACFFADFIRYISTLRIFGKFSFLIFDQRNYDAIFYDVFEERKYYIFPFLSYFYNFKRISLSHGGGINWVHLHQFRKHQIWINFKKLLILDYTGINKSFFEWNLSKKNFNYKVIGIPKHELEKNILIKNKNKIKKNLIEELNLDNKVKFFTLASRPDDNNWCNSLDRKKYLKTIGEFLLDNSDWHLLIKSHPKESSSSKKLWSKDLGISHLSSSFSISSISILELASISEFGFCFVSDCCIDFSFFGKPMYELTSKEKTVYGNLTTFFSVEGYPITLSAYKKLSFNIREISQLKRLFKEIFPELKKCSKEANLAYKNCFGHIKYRPNLIIDILDSIEE